MSFADRRNDFGSQMEPGSVAVLFTAPTFPRNGDVTHAFRFESDFFYLTGFTEPESVAVIRPGHEQPFVMFVRPRDPAKEIWDGKRAGVDGACNDFGANIAYPMSELPKQLPGLIENTSALYFTLGRHEADDETVLNALRDVRRRVRTGVRAPKQIIEPGTLLHEMRLRKRPDEVETLARACELSAQAHVEAMRQATPGQFEYEIQGLLDYHFRKGGSQRNGYPSIVGSGPNACILHYIENNRRMEAGDLLLIDAGAEVDGYSADITRTFPVGGRFSDAQRKVYEVVLDAQEKAIAACTTDHTFMQIHETALRALVEGMIRIGLLTGTPEEVIEEKRYTRYFMHKTGHWLGMDVHDVGAYKDEQGNWRTLEPGMVTTVEPGLYIAPNDDEAPEEYRGIGIRIEDDILVTDGAPRNLTAGVPKSVAEVEALTAG
jgi:Xaa-Pro aminopeptidase